MAKSVKFTVGDTKYKIGDKIRFVKPSKEKLTWTCVGGGGPSKKKTKTIRSSEAKESFIDYMLAHPGERFWQSVRNWSGFAFIYVTDEPTGEGESYDTFYWEGKDA
jgi:hypothetical protein